MENLRTNQDVKDYIKEFTGPSVMKYNRDQLNVIGIRLGYNDKMGVKTGSGLRRRLIRGRGSPDRESESDEERGARRRTYPDWRLSERVVLQQVLEARTV